LKTREFDMVILSQALTPSETNAAVAEKIGVSLDDFGFVSPSQDLLNPFATTCKRGFCLWILSVAHGCA
jgi:heterodisulfide reductase subunit A-like polyferredoxin